MKKISFLMVTMLMACSIVMAQGPRRGERQKIDPKTRAERMTERMVKEYSLNDTQKQQLYELNLTMAEDTKDRPAMRPGREKQRAQMQEKRETYNGKLKGIMTSDQYAAYEKKQAEQKERMQKNREHRRGDRKPAVENKAS